MFKKNKIINYLTQKGKKTKSEKILNKSLKELQKNSKKQSKKLVKLSLILSSAVFNVREITNKKSRKHKIRIKPTFLYSSNKRFAFAIKLIVSAAKKSYESYFYNKLKEEFFSAIQYRSNVIKIKINLEKQALKEKRLLNKYYRWT